MGYDTSFSGEFNLDKPLSQLHADYLRAFADTRRMKRDANKTELRSDLTRLSVGLPVGDEGGYFVGSEAPCGQDYDSEDVIDGSMPPLGQPGLWCKWEPNEANTAIEWNGVEKFYDYVEWIEYLIEHFLEPWGYTLNGEVEWDGEERGDIGKIVVVNNQVSVKQGRIAWD